MIQQSLPWQSEPAAADPAREGSHPGRSRSRKRKWLLPALLVALGVGILAVLIETKPAPKKALPQVTPISVEVLSVRPRSVRALLQARGRVRAARRVELVPHVAGPVAWVSDDLIPGGRFEAGERLLRVDPVDYRLAVEMQRAEVERARVELRREQNRKQASERAFALYESRSEGDGPPLGSNGSALDRPFLLNEPQLEAARQALRSAESRLEQAQVNLRRTTLRAPFNSQVQEERVEEGQRVTPQAPVVTLIGTDAFWVQASIDVDDVGLIRIPGVQGARKGDPATIAFEVQGEETQREGRVLRLLGELDPEGTMARVLIEVPDPLGLKEGDASGPPLLIGSFVRVSIRGRSIPDVAVLPERAVHQGDQLWLMSDEGRLEIREVTVVRRQAGTVLVRGDVGEEAQVVASNIPLPVEGMRLSAARDVSTASRTRENSSASRHRTAPRQEHASKSEAR